MSLAEVVGLVVAVALLGYLLVALLRADRLS
jgi:K+-transporting ATPase KdpF subunit